MDSTLPVPLAVRHTGLICLGAEAGKFEAVVGGMRGWRGWHVAETRIVLRRRGEG
jgi:hypothetical protein